MTRALIIKAVDEGNSYRAAAALSGRRSALAVSNLVTRFNREGIKALHSKNRGKTSKYTTETRQKIIDTFLLPPDRKMDGTATWSLTTLQKKLEKIDAGYFSRFTLWKVLHEAGYSFQKDRTWVKTGIVRRNRGGAMVEVADPDAEAKKN